ncbi:hypothetical protein D5272_03340 [bacterium D16-76]|nr:hypothetical protein [bacterium D16-76]
MVGNTTVKYLQEYIKAKDFNPELKKEYFLKLSEEFGELAVAIRKKQVRAEGETVKGTIDEEVWDVIYYAIALANCYGIDLERTIAEKEELNRIKYNRKTGFETGK